MPRRHGPLVLSHDESSTLRSLAESRHESSRTTRHARALLLAAEGRTNTDVAFECGVSAETVRRWRRAFESEGAATVGRIRPGRGRRPSIGDEVVAAIVHDTTDVAPPEGADVWTTRALAERHGVSKDTIARIWDRHGVTPTIDRPPHRARNDPNASPSSRRLDRDRIADAALDAGLDELTISGVARALGVTHGALYRYVENRDDLAFAAVERVAQSLDWPASDLPWDTHLVEIGRRTRRAFDRHPGVYGEVIRLGAPPTFARYEEQTHALLVDAGFSPDDATLAMSMLWHLVQDTAREAESGRYDTRPTEDQIDRKLRVLVVGLASLLDDSQAV